MSNPKKVLQDFAFKLSYRNTLPEIPFDPKLLEHPFPKDRHYKYTYNSLYASTPHLVYAADDENGLPLNLLAHGYLENAFRNPHAALLQPNPDALDPEDLELLVPPVDAKLASDNAEATRVRPVVPWLRRTEYVAVEGKTYGRRADTGVETKMGISIKKDKHLSSLMDRSEEAQMLAIENTFETAAAATLSNLKHPTNPDLKLVEIFPIYPDFEFWPNLYQLVTFDDDPISRAPGGGATDADGTEYEHDLKLDRAIIKPIANPEDDTDFTMAFYTPTDASASAVREHRERQKHLMAQGHDIEDEDEDQSHEYKFRRDFDESVSKSNYPFCIELRKEEGGAFYSMLPKRMTLRKKRALNKRERDYDVEYEKPTKILVSHRELTAEEISERNTKMKDLLQRDDIDDE